MLASVNLRNIRKLNPKQFTKIGASQLDRALVSANQTF